MAAPTVEETPIPGLLVVRLDLRRDDRGWFMESWQRAKMTALGLPDFGPLQSNVAFNLRRGTTRGMHAEPWDKLVTVVAGRAYGAWVDLREGGTFGTTHTTELEPGVAVFVPRGVANGYQTLDDATSYTYLINDHWQPDAAYLTVDPDDPALALAWPVPPGERVLSERDRSAPRLSEVSPFAGRRPLVIGADGQAGSALMTTFPEALGVDLDELDLTDSRAVERWPWREHDLVLNAAAWTAVDAAETDEGRRRAWALNAEAPAALAALGNRHGFTLVHYSSDYVFDGSRAAHDEQEPLAPLGVYGQSKAAGDLAVAAASRSYVIRTSWLIGEGPNFVRTMARLAVGGGSPRVVADQVGRLTFTDELARGTRHLLETRAPYGTYHLSNAGPPMSWAAVAREVFSLYGRDAGDVTPVTTEEYAVGRDAPIAQRPRSSVLTLDRMRATGFEPRDALVALRDYCTSWRP
jgi:dTDP-4-dehydrorhamnose reductase/dTDP-4-dehydrorhamnose 3,5-epimerase